MAMLVGLIGLTGTDFSRQLPQVSGRTVFGYLPDLWPALMTSYDPERGQLDVAGAADRLVGAIYSAKFATHVRGVPASLLPVLAALRGSKLSERTLSSLPSPAQIRCTVRNVNWILRYWRDPDTVPAPGEVSPAGEATYGYVRRKGIVTYADSAA